VFGDSLSAGYGIDPSKGWVNLLTSKLRDAGYKYRVVNASVSGETTAGGLARLPRALKVQQPDIVVLELGGNDGLRALPLADTRANMEQMIVLAGQAKRQVLVLGVQLPANYGARFNTEFATMYAGLAHKHNAAVVPFFISGVVANSSMMQADGIHPNESGQPGLLNNIWPVLAKLLRH
jgi:acyl-CoA thioesterase-1